MNYVIFCPGSILPVHPDAVEDDGGAHVKEEVNKSSNEGNRSTHDVKTLTGQVENQNGETSHVEDE